MKTAHQTSLFETETRECKFSPCRTFRYRLKIVWNPDLPIQIFIGLNPSTADEKNNDPTVRRWIAFAKAWGYGGILILNVYAYRSTDWTALLTVEDPKGPDNRSTIALAVASSAIRPIACWGVHATEVGAEVPKQIADSHGPFDCLGTNGDGSPCHPLYLKGDTLPRPWTATPSSPSTSSQAQERE